MVQVACKQVHLGSAPQLDQLEQLSLCERLFCGVKQLRDRKSANSLLAPGPCIALTVLELGINH